MAIELKDSKRWINSFLAVLSILFGMICISFFEQMGEWFDLEAKVQYFQAVNQVLGVLFGLGFFLFCSINKASVSHLNEVYGELVKVVWPERDVVVKMTIGVVVGVTIISSIFVLTDFIFQKILDLLY
jgi:preprotein translocase subunit SecE